VPGSDLPGWAGLPLKGSRRANTSGRRLVQAQASLGRSWSFAMRRLPKPWHFLARKRARRRANGSHELLNCSRERLLRITGAAGRAAL